MESGTFHEPDKRDAAIEALLVEFGIDFAFDEDYNLPNRLPEEMTGVKAVTFDDDSRNDYLNGPMGDKLRAFAEAGGVVAKISGNDNQNPIDENRTRGNIDMLIASANLTMDHPRLRQRLQARPFQQLLDELQEGYLARQIDGGLTKGLDTVFNEPYAYNILHLMEVLHEVEPDCGWHDRLRNVLDQILQMCEPDLHSLDRTSGLSVFFRMEPVKVATLTDYSSFDYNGFAAPAALGDGERKNFADLTRTRNNQPIKNSYGVFEKLTSAMDREHTYQPDELNFTLRPNGAPVDAGTLLPNINDDYVGNAPDLGAMEYGGPSKHFGPRPR